MSLSRPIGPMRPTRPMRPTASAPMTVATVGTVTAVAVVAWLVGQVVTLLGPAAVALVLGAAVRIAVPAVAGATRDFAGLGTRLLQLSIILLGASIGLFQVLSVAGDALPVMAVTIFGGLAAIWLVGGRWQVPITVRGLLAVGTSICGASAIAAAAPALGASAADVSYAVAVVFMFNFVAVVLFPLLAHAMDMAPAAFAVWAGTAINDTSSVLAASAAFGAATVASATVVKLARTLMILPVTIAIALLARRIADQAPARSGDAQTDRGMPLGVLLRRAVPWFAVCFVAASSINAIGLVPDVAARAFGTLAGLGVVAALAAVGLSSDVQAIRRAGPQPLVLAAAGWILIACLSLVMQRATGLL